MNDLSRRSSSGRRDEDIAPYLAVSALLKFRQRSCSRNRARSRGKQSQRDCALQPKVASSELPWE